MTTIRSILVATDFTAGANAAVERSVQLATLHKAPLRLLHSFDIGAWHSLGRVFDVQRLTIDPPSDVLTQQRLTAAAAELAAQTGLQVGAHFAVGPADKAIDAYVKAHACSLLVVGARAEPDWLGLGGTAEKVVRAPGCPVLIVRSSPPRPYDKVLVAVDLREASLRASRFALELLPDANHLLLYAVDPALERGLWIGGLGKEHIGLVRDSMHSHAERELQGLAQSLERRARHPVSAEVVDDMSSRAIVARAAAWPADCVVVGHHGEGPMAERWLGNMARHVIHHTTRDVLVVP